MIYYCEQSNFEIVIVLTSLFAAGFDRHPLQYRCYSEELNNLEPYCNQEAESTPPTPLLPNSLCSAKRRGNSDQTMNAVPFPLVAFPDPEIQKGERDFPILLEPNGRVVDGYLRRDSHDHTYAYERYEKTINLGAKGKILYGRIHEKSSTTAGSYVETEAYVVIKKLSKACIWNHGGIDNVTESPKAEIAVAQMIGDNEHVVGMYEALEDQKYLYLIMPYFGTDLFDAVTAASNDAMMDEEQRAPSPDAALLLKTLCRNLLFLQAHNIIHRDISPENVIVHGLRGEECCPLIDFAMALQCATLEQQSLPLLPQAPCGKLPYMSPEVVREDPLDFGVDVYSLGCTLFFIWTGGRLLYERPGDRCFTFFIQQNGILEAPRVDMDMWLSVPGLPMDWNPLLEKLPLVQDLSHNQRDLLAHMLHIDPTERLTVPEIVQHAYLQEVQARR